MKNTCAITAFYKFFRMEEADVQRVRDALDAKGMELDMRGLTLIAPEGVNGTVAGSKEAIQAYKELLEELCGEMIFKDSSAEQQPFKRWFVKIRKEIVGLGKTDVYPETTKNCHLTPTEWNEVLDNEDVVLIDTRNDYEVEIGTFKNAVDPKLKQFSEFPEYVKKSGIPKDKKVLMFCTGGIRCEKALIEMKNQGYEHVYQLEGGILKYLEECPHDKFEGECFVFDHRTSVNQELDPSEVYHICPHCGDPGKEQITCDRCEADAVICERCKKKEYLNTCSKNCAHCLQRDLEKAGV